MKKIQINENELRKSVRKHLIEQSVSGAKDNREEKQRCVAGNVMPLDELVGPSDNFSDYASGVLKRDGGINGMVANPFATSAADGVIGAPNTKGNNVYYRFVQVTNLM